MASTTIPHVGKSTVWEIDPKHTLVEFGVRHMMFTTVKGRLAGVQGTIVADEADPTRSSVQVEIDAASIDTREDQRDAHLRSADFLDVERHPKMVFKSARIQRLSKDQFRMAGDLTIRGTTREVEMEGTFNGRGLDPWGNERVGFSAETSIDRRDFGLTWNQALETGGILVGDAVKINLEVQATKRQMGA